jgi:hypothetical protein
VKKDAPAVRSPRKSSSAPKPKSKAPPADA